MFLAMILLGVVSWFTIAWVAFAVEDDRRRLEDAEVDVRRVMSWR